VAEVSRKVLGMRYRAMPYLYTQHFFAHTAGCPIARPLFFTFPADNATRNVSDQWMIGDALMVSPVIQQVRHKQGSGGFSHNISLIVLASRCVVDHARLRVWRPRCCVRLLRSVEERGEGQPMGGKKRLLCVGSSKSVTAISVTAMGTSPHRHPH